MRRTIDLHLRALVSSKKVFPVAPQLSSYSFMAPPCICTCHHVSCCNLQYNLKWDPSIHRHQIRKNKYEPLEAVLGGRALPERDPSSSSAHVGAALLRSLMPSWRWRSGRTRCAQPTRRTRRGTAGRENLKHEFRDLALLTLSRSFRV